MNKKLLLIISFFLAQIVIYSQNKPLLLKGFVKDSLGVVVDANVLNLKTMEGAFSNEVGVFEIKASEGDTIQITSIQHIKKKLVVLPFNYNRQEVNITLKINVNILDEIELRQNNLIGILGADMKFVPLKKRDSILKENMNYIKKANKGKLKPDFIDTNVKPPLNDVDPISKLAGRPEGGIGLKNKSITKERKKKMLLGYKRAFPKILLNDLGEDFFFTQLKIPKERYYHFLEYCNPLGIEEMYRNDKKLEVIKILKKEHIGYLKIINQE